MNKFLISASILSADFARLGKDTDKVISSGADVIHFDVMDNHYVPNLSIGPMVLKSLRNYGINAPIDVHLMVNPIERLILEFADAGATYITFHYEATEHVDRYLQLIKDNGCKAGIGFNPATPINSLEYILNKIDLILLMSVNPGFSGQSFIYSTFNKLRKARSIIKYSDKNIILEVDGGIKLNNIYDIANAGANMFVVGSAIFNKNNYKNVIKNFRNKLKLIVNT